MKNLIISFGMITIAFFTIVTVAALNINSTKQNDLNESTRMAVYQTLEQLYDPGITESDEPGEYIKIDSNDDLQLAFNNNLSRLLRSNDKVTVKILAIDFEEGLLSVNVSTTYKNMGISRTIDTTQTVIREQTISK